MAASMATHSHTVLGHCGWLLHWVNGVDLFLYKCIRRDISLGDCKDEGRWLFEWVALHPYLEGHLIVFALLVAYFSSRTTLIPWSLPRTRGIWYGRWYESLSGGEPSYVVRYKRPTFRCGDRICNRLELGEYVDFRNCMSVANEVLSPVAEIAINLISRLGLTLFPQLQTM